MATRRQSGRSMNAILQDSTGAKKRFGFGGAPQSAITTAPKQADQWFIEFTSTDGSINDVSAQAQSVSPITIQTTTQPIDRYGRREYIPTRVDFPEVTVTMYDTVDGKIMTFAKDIYSKFFKNSTLGVSGGAMRSTIEDINSGRKVHVSNLASHKNFDKVSVYHFFGAFDTGTGTIQRIVLINPVVTSITFSESDYSASALRTVTFTLQPENIIFGTPEDSVASPTWMQEGLPIVMEDFPVDASKELESKAGNSASGRNKNIGVGVGPSKPLSDDQKKRLNELKRSKNKLDAVLADPNATQEDKDAARRRYELAKENSKDIFQVDGQVEEKNTSLEEQKNRAAPKLQQAPTGEARPDLTSNPDTKTYEESWSGRNIGGEPYRPGVEMSDTQIAAIQTSLAMSNENVYPESVMKDYNSSIAAKQARRNKEAEAAQSDLNNPGIRGRMTEEERAEAEKKAKQNDISNLKKQQGPQ
jgi:hypothetical protein